MQQSIENFHSIVDWLFFDPTGQLVGIAGLLFYLLVWWRILARAGFPGPMGVLMLVPPLAILLWAFLAFSPWPARAELTALRKVQRVVHRAEKRRLVA